MAAPVTLTEKLLMDTGGWKAMKEAGRLHQAGAVEEASYQKGKLEGLVVHQGKSRKVRVDIKTRTWWDNHCSCPVARREGAVCAHALAVALQTIDPVDPAPSVSASGPETGGSPAATTAPEKAKNALSRDWPKVTERPDESKAVPAFLSVILAPNLSRGWEQQRLTVGIEIVLEEAEPVLFASLAGKNPGKLFLGPRDLALYRTLQALSPEQLPGMMQIGRPEFLRLLDSLAGHPRVRFGKKANATVAFTPLRPPLRIEGTRLQIDWPESLLPLGEPEAESTWALEDETFHPIAPGLPVSLRSVFSPSGFSLTPANAGSALAAFSESFDLPEPVAERLPTPIPPAVELDLEGSLNHLEAKLFFRCRNLPRRPAGSTASRFLSDPEDPDRLLAPDTLAEQAAIDFLLGWGFDGPDDKGAFVLKDKSGILRFFAHGVPRIDEDWKVRTGPRFDHASQKVEPVTTTFDFTGSGENWFAMEVEFDTPSGSRFSREYILQLLQKGQNHREVSGGRIAVIDTDLVDDLQETLADLEASQEQPGVFRVGKEQAGYLRQTATEAGIETTGSKPWIAPSESGIEISPLPAELDDLLRPYQREGIEWMQSLARRGMGGVLADDMGLGKTLQALAFVRSLHAADQGPALVVCPSSLVHNWIAEAEKFVPELKAVALQGPERESVFEANADADIFVTSHTLLRIDAERYRQRSFGVAILDEAQHIKNPDSQVAKAAHGINAVYRFALTGTPIENSVRDLWSVMQFALPGYLGARKEFTERFEKPIGGGNVPGVQRRLSRRLKPVILRRLKSEVARDLPDKIEQVIYCDLREEQRAVYEQVLRESRTAVHEAEGGRQRMLALTALLRLRQACCDLRLLGLPDVTPEEASVKLDAVEELIADAVEGGHRVLVFSQFVEMLQVLVPMLAERGWKHTYLDGSTRNRGEVVRRFQESDDIPVFLVSLKAGGVGLNLTAADTVIHVDPWWNPAVEAQATDRAHRIGQERVVTSYKLIARGTVEEKILALQEKKKEAFRSLIDSGGESGDAGLSEDEILDLIDS